MDHHCPWTINCVSHRTFPHFFRFLFYSVTAMLYLEYFLYIRLAILFQNRSLPSVRNPSSVINTLNLPLQKKVISLMRSSLNQHSTSAPPPYK